MNTTTQELPKLYSLKDLSQSTGGKISVGTLRREIKAERLHCIRSRPGCNSPVLVRQDEYERWLDEVAGKRQHAQSPSAAAKGRSAA